MSDFDNDRRRTDTNVLLLQQKLEDHIQSYKKHCEENEKRWERLMVSQEHNTQCVRELTETTRALTESTHDIVMAWNAANGTIKTATVVGRFLKWLSGFAIIATFIAWLSERIN